jgi:hypothetical protein
VRRCKTTVAELAAEVIEAKRRTGVPMLTSAICASGSPDSVSTLATAQLPASPQRRQTTGSAISRCHPSAEATIAPTWE